MRLLRICCALAAIVLSSTPALAQGGANSSLTGVVVDGAGGVIPGATVAVKNNATGSTFESVSNSAGAFSVPALDPGTYTVTVALDGFKTAVINDVRLLAATPGEHPGHARGRRAHRDGRGQGRHRAGADAVLDGVVDDQHRADHQPAARLAQRAQLRRRSCPASRRRPGRAARRSAACRRTRSTSPIDGVNVNNNFQSTDGFFSMVTPRLDAVEEVTVTGATPGADQAALGAVQVAFVTRSGTNQFDGSIYHYFRHPKLNSNYFFNEINGLEKNEVIVHQYGGRVGGPIVIPGLVDGRNKAFFFFNMEEFYQPTEATRTRTILNPQAQEGWFRYNVTVDGVQQVREVNLLALAAQNGQLATPDPTIAALLANDPRRRPARPAPSPTSRTRRRSSTSTRAPAPAVSTRRPAASTSTCRRTHRLSGIVLLAAVR